MFLLSYLSYDGWAKDQFVLHNICNWKVEASHRIVSLRQWKNIHRINFTNTSNLTKFNTSHLDTCPTPLAAAAASPSCGRKVFHIDLILNRRELLSISHVTFFISAWCAFAFKRCIRILCSMTIRQNINCTRHVLHFVLSL